MVYAVIRVRGSVNVNPDIKKTLHLLRLNKVNHCVLVTENDVYKGMLQMVKDYTTWGEINKETLTKLITKRGMLMGDKPITPAYLKSSTSYETMETLASALLDNTITYQELPDVKPLFRLNPPKQGYGTIKRSFVRGGTLGYRKNDINALLEKML